MKVLFLVNPYAGGKGNRAAVDIACSRFADAGWDTTTIRTESPDHSAELIGSAHENGYELLVVAGGDGTLLNTIQHLPLGSHENPSILPFGIIPLGSGNDFYRGTGAPRDPAGAAENIINGKPVPIDVGLCEPINDDGSPRDEKPVRFINTAGVGMDSQTLATREKAPSWLSARYEFLFLVTLIRMYPLEVTLETDEWNETVDAFWVLCCNNSHIGTGMQVAPDAKINDGLFDVLIIPKMPKIKFVMNLPKVFRGKHLEMKGVEIRRASNIVLKCKPGQRVAVDGDLEFPAPVRIRNLSGAVSLWASRLDSCV